MNKILSLYTHCFINKGHSRSSIIDLQRHQVHLIPNQMADLLLNADLNTDEVLTELSQESKKVFKQYIAFLEEHELVFWTTQHELKHFPQMSREWQFPAHISNCILDTLTHFDYLDERFLNQLDNLCCNFIQFRFFNDVSFDYLVKLLNLINDSPVKSIEIILPEQKNENFYESLLSFVEHNRKIRLLVVTQADINEIFRENINGFSTILKIKNSINNDSHCGLVDSRLFVINSLHYTESLAHNTCLNRKIAIDVDGNIKNCPSMKESFGNIKDTTLEEAINQPGFKKYWNITKDEITKCKDCEFRHICTDCRAYIENPDDIYSAPLKCGYNPYTCEWEEWSTNPLKQQAIEYYGMSKMIKQP